MKLIHTSELSPAGYRTKIYRNSEWDEFVVRLYHDGHHDQDADYHTPDKDDAFATAKSMVEHAAGRIRVAMYDRLCK